MVPGPRWTNRHCVGGSIKSRVNLVSVRKMLILGNSWAYASKFKTQNISKEADSHSAAQEISHYSLKPYVH
jgi:hypothetical protein